MLLAKYYLDRLNQSCIVWGENTHTHTMGKRHSIPTSEPHLSCEVWWTGHHGLEMVCCSGTWTACYQWLKTEFSSLSRHFAGECAASWSSTIWMMQHENNLNRMSNSTTELFQKKKIHLLEWLRPALTWQRCFVDREWFTPDIPRILLNWKSFVKSNGANFLLTVVLVGFTNTENVWGTLLLPKEGQPVIKSSGSQTCQ